MLTKVIFDGTLFSECELMNLNRSGMLRLTEDITRNLVEIGDIDIAFANTVYTEQFDRLLRKFVADNYPSLKHKIISGKPFFVSDVPKLRGLLKRLANYLSLQTNIKNINSYDVFHSFYYPFSANVQKKKIKKSITFLDIIPLRLEGYPHEIKVSTNKIIDSIRPNFAIAISEFSRQDLLDYDRKINPERIFVSPLAASKEIFFQNNNVDEWHSVQRKYDLPEKYFLSVSSNDRRKNIHHLIKCFSRFVLQQRPKDIFLVLTGNFMYSYSILDELNITKEVKDRIIITKKYIDNKDLSVVYSKALCFFFMSLYEGFGLPVLEAMQCGTPVVTSNVTSIPEIVGESAILLPPLDEDLLCNAMNDMFLNSDLRNKYSLLGLERAKLFSWERCAMEYAAIFKKIDNDFK